MKKCITGLNVAQESPQHHEDEKYQKWYKEKKRKDTHKKVKQFRPWQSMMLASIVATQVVENQKKF
jgi:hypothetical protein